MKNNGQNRNGTAVLDDDAVLNQTLLLDEDDDEPRVEPDSPAIPDKKRKRRVPVAFVVLVVAVVGGIVVFLMFTGALSRKSSTNVSVTGKQEQQKEVTRAADADQSINSFATGLRTDAPVTAPPQGIPVTQAPSVTLVPQPVFGAAPYDSSAPITAAPAPGAASTAGVAGTVTGASPGTASTSATTGAGQVRQAARRDAPAPEIASEPASQSSSYFFQPADVKPVAAARVENNSTATGFKPVSPFDKGIGRGANATGILAAPVKPPFGATLPVRALGAIYTLRNDGYVRLELTRAVRGEGWSLQRGTQFIGKLSGAEGERAFISLLGFIDPASQKLVRVGGEVKGIDGGDGLKGTRKRLGSRWVGALKAMGSAGLQLTTAWLGSRNGGTQVIMPPSSTFPGVSNSRAPVTEFVAVKAGTLGTVMITDLPEAIEGAQPAASGLAQSGDAGLSEDEMVGLMTGDDAQAIRDAMPRMSAEQRKVATYALQQPN